MVTGKFNVPCSISQSPTKFDTNNRVDWAGQMAIRASGQTVRFCTLSNTRRVTTTKLQLRELLNEYVVKPLGISSEELGSFITPGMELKKVAVHAKIDEKTFVAIPFSTVSSLCCKFTLP